MRKTLLALLLVAACTDNTGPAGGDDGSGSGSDGSGSGSGSGGDVSAAEKQRDYDDVATLLGANLSAGDLVAMIDAVDLAYGRIPAGFTVSDRSGYQLVDGTRNGLTIEYKLYCKDAADALVPCNGAELHAHVKPTFSGSIAGASTAMQGVQRSAAWIVRDLALPTPQLGGDGTETFSAKLATGDYSLVINDKVSHVPFNATPTNPLAGTIGLTINVDRTRASANPSVRTFDVTATIAFDGSGAATVTLDSTQRYRWTLATGAVVKAN